MHILFLRISTNINKLFACFYYGGLGLVFLRLNSFRSSKQIPMLATQSTHLSSSAIHSLVSWFGNMIIDVTAVIRRFVLKRKWQVIQKIDFWHRCSQPLQVSTEKQNLSCNPVDVRWFGSIPVRQKTPKYGNDEDATFAHQKKPERMLFVATTAVAMLR